jgi:hypothetical protein
VVGQKWERVRSSLEAEGSGENELARASAREEKRGAHPQMVEAAILLAKARGAGAAGTPRRPACRGGESSDESPASREDCGTRGGEATDPPAARLCCPHFSAPTQRLTPTPAASPPNMVLLGNDAVITRLTALFAARTGSGSIFITQKRRACPVTP